MVQQSKSDKASQFYERKNKSMDLVRENDTFAILSFCLAFGFLIPLVNYIYPLFALASFVCGFIALNNISKDEKKKGKVWAVFGMIVSFFGLLGMLYLLTFL